MSLLNSLDKYSIAEADNLIKNIEFIGDIRNVKVRNPDTGGYDACSLREWVNWLIKRMNTVGEFGVEVQFLNIIKELDLNAQLIVERAKESTRRLFLVLERQDKEITLLTEELNKQKNINTKEEEKEEEKTPTPPPTVVEPPKEKSELDYISSVKHAKPKQS